MIDDEIKDITMQDDDPCPAFPDPHPRRSRLDCESLIPPPTLDPRLNFISPLTSISASRTLALSTRSAPGFARPSQHLGPELHQSRRSLPARSSTPGFGPYSAHIGPRLIRSAPHSVSGPHIGHDLSPSIGPTQSTDPRSAYGISGFARSCPRSALGQCSAPVAGPRPQFAGDASRPFPSKQSVVPSDPGVPVSSQSTSQHGERTSFKAVQRFPSFEEQWEEELGEFGDRASDDVPKPPKDDKQAMKYYKWGAREEIEAKYVKGALVGVLKDIKNTNRAFERTPECPGSIDSISCVEIGAGPVRSKLRDEVQELREDVRARLRSSQMLQETEDGMRPLTKGSQRLKGQKQHNTAQSDAIAKLQEQISALRTEIGRMQEERKIPEFNLTGKTLTEEGIREHKDQLAKQVRKLKKKIAELEDRQAPTQ